MSQKNCVYEVRGSKEEHEGKKTDEAKMPEDVRISEQAEIPERAEIFEGGNDKSEDNFDRKMKSIF